VTKTEADAEAARTAAVKRDADSALATARSGGVNPTTGLSFTAAEIEQLVTSASTAAQAATQAAQAARESAGAIEAATAELRTAQVRLNDTPALNTAAVQQAIDSVTAAKLRKSEMNETSDGLSSARASTQSAQRSVQQANEELARELAKGGISVPAGEVVFVDADSVRVEEVTLNAGDAATGKLMTVTGARFAVAASVSTADRDLLTLGAKVTIEASDAGIETTGEITSIAEKAGTDGLDEQHVRVMISMDSVPTGAQQLNDLPVRITIPISSTGDTLVLVVPVAAVSLAADGTSRVEVETDPKKETKLVNVKPGISSNGLVQVDPLEEGSLNEGDRVVVGASGQESS
jgi:multidrug efflux pump subunit AcrA (membrane-fusion protein)